MPVPPHNIIVSALPDPVRKVVTLAWANGETTVSHFTPIAGTGVFRALADASVFALVRVGDGGRSLEWPGDIDFCADALWFEAHPEEALQPDPPQHEPAPR